MTEPDEIGRIIGRERGALRRVLGLPFAVMGVTGGTIGSGILRAPGPVAAAAPGHRVMLLLWLAGGVLALVEALPLLELAAALPRAGGPIVYVERAFGRFWGALVGWSSWLQCTVGLGFLAVISGEYAQRLGATWPVVTLALLLVAALTLLNVANARAAGRHQIAVQGVKLVGLAALIVLLFAGPAHPPSPMTAPVPAGGLALAALLVNNAYQGWGGVVAFGEELRDPTRTLARALFGGLAVVTLFYLGMVAALLHALPVAAIARSTLPVADAAARVLGPEADRVITAVSLLAVVSLANLTAMLGARILLAMARAGAAPPILARVERNGAPAAATVMGGVGAALLAATGAYLALNAVYAPLAIFTAVAVLLAAVRLRRAEPALARPWRMPLYPLPVLIALAANLALLVAVVAAAPRDVVGGVGLLALGAPLTLIGRRRAG